MAEYRLCQMSAGRVHPSLCLAIALTACQKKPREEAPGNLPNSSLDSFAQEKLKFLPLRERVARCR
ncbi:MAG: hypothetical protein FWC28_06340 [Proteobacteria bacterium]|nr:hypothetical protein [Pseudomonadota bacterium]